MKGSNVIIKPKVRGFICTTTHPKGCEQNVLEQIEATRARGLDKSQGPKKVLVIGASSGYGLAARITAAFGYGADTLGVFLKSRAPRRSRAPLAGTTAPRSISLPSRKVCTANPLMAMRSPTKRGKKPLS